MSRTRCACGQPKHWEARMCEQCWRSVRTERARWREEDAFCACGGHKDVEARQCAECRRAAFAQEALSKQAVPPICQCRDSGMVSRFHCRCGRWKPSAALVCEVCLPLVERVNGHVAA